MLIVSSYQQVSFSLSFLHSNTIIVVINAIDQQLLSAHQ